MICKSCEKETEKGNFCEHCGASLTDSEQDVREDPVDTGSAEELLQADEVAATEDMQETSSDAEPETAEKPNEAVEMIKDEGARLGKFLLALIKKPTDAKKMGEDYFISGVTVTVLLALLISLNQFIHAKSLSFFEAEFFIPLLKYLLVFGLLGIIIFVAAKVGQQELSIKETYAKYGAYLVPFALLFVAGLIFSLIKLWLLYTIATMFSLVGIVLFIPIFILSEQEVKGFDLVYTTITVTLVSFIIFGYLLGGTIIASLVDVLGQSLL